MLLKSEVYETIQNLWKNEALTGLQDFIRLPALSRAFDPEWESKGILKQALVLAKDWGKAQLPHATFEILESPTIPPALKIRIPAFQNHNGKPAFLYGHLDKQPEAGEWAEGLGPWLPVIKDNLLYGRGSVDDGYNFFLCLTAIKALEDHGVPHPEIFALFETDEESGSRDLASYVNAMTPEVGSPAFIAIADLDALDQSRIWLTQSLRGSIALTVRVSVLNSPAHSGMASGIVPSSFRIMRSLLDRIEKAETGELLLPELNTDIPEDILNCIEKLAATADVRKKFNWAGETTAAGNSAFEALLQNTWKPSLCITGADGLPSCSQAGNVLRTSTTLKLSLRTPPTVDAPKALEALKQALTHDVPYNATVEILDTEAASGFVSPLPTGWLLESLNQSSQSHFDHEPGYVFCGASIGTLPMFSKAFPDAPFVNTGALGPSSNAHAPNECLDLPYTVKLTCIFADLIANIPKDHQ